MGTVGLLVVFSSSAKDLDFKFVYVSLLLTFFMQTIEKYIGSSIIIWSPCFVIFFSGLFLPLNVLLAVCRLEGGHDTSIILLIKGVISD